MITQCLKCGLSKCECTWPNEPDWKSLCKELHDALVEIWHDSELPSNRAYEAIKKYEELNK